ncbi:unannotated protein [freshwater metagenome]
MFFSDPVEDGTSVIIPSLLTRLSIVTAFAITIFLGVFPAPLLNFISSTAIFIR